MSDEKTADQPLIEDEPKPDPREAEAVEADVVEFEHKGETFVIPRNYPDWPFGYTYEMESGHPARAFAHLLGNQQFARLMATEPTNRDFDDLDTKIADALGVKSGESAAS